MKLPFGLEIRRSEKALSPATSRGGWWPLIRESYAGAWQQNVTVTAETALSNPVFFRCVALIRGDISKMGLCLTGKDSSGIWSEIQNPAYSPVLRKPNPYQNRIQFIDAWLGSKLLNGNTYALKVRDARGVVTGLYILDPLLVLPLISDSGEVFYRLKKDNLSGLVADELVVPAREIIHDRWNCLFHPLVGLSPLFAAGLSSVQGVEIAKASTYFFKNGARPSGILTAPGAISDETAARLKEAFETGYSGENAGKTAVVGDGLKYEAMTTKAVDAQLVEQAKWSNEAICTAFGVPAYMVGVGAAPLNNNAETLAGQYYSQCLQTHIESLELCLEEGLGLDTSVYGIEFDLDDLLRMDASALVKSEAEAVKGGIKSPNEARRRMNLPPVDGGEEPYLQQQNYSLGALARRDETQGAPDSPDAAPAAEAPPEDTANDNAEAQRALALGHYWKRIANGR